MNLRVNPAAAIIANAILQGTNVMLTWSGGIAPFQVQQKTNLLNPGWQNVGSPSSTHTLTIPVSNRATFFRIGGQ